MTINVSGDAITNCQNAATAWVNFDGTGTVAIRDDYNVDSITDNGTGDYTVNFTSALADANYTYPTCSSQNETLVLGGATTASFTVYTRDASSTNSDTSVVTTTVFGGE